MLMMRGVVDDCLLFAVCLLYLFDLRWCVFVFVTYLFIVVCLF